jgi:Asp-tRNA(Asn)/Glu-tRNA(Gln) amidotransferase A subunit family amidase
MTGDPAGGDPAASERPGRDLAGHDLVGTATAVCERIERADPGIRAFVPEPGRRARLLAAAADLQARSAGAARQPALYGLVAGIKDVIRVDGLPTRAGSGVPAEVLGGPQAAVVSRLVADGALVAGKTVTAEFAVIAPGPTRNPRAPGHTPGGSSSGSAAAVAAGMVPLALGTQTIASVIRPAAYCGVAGFRPTYGRVPADGVIAYAPSLDTVGWFAPAVAGLARAAAVLCADWRPRAAGRAPVLAIPAGPYLEAASATALEQFAAHVTRLRAAGIAVRDEQAPGDFGEIMRALYVITRYELARGHARWYASHPDGYRPPTVAMIEAGQAIGAGEYAAAVRFQASFAARVAAEMAAHGIDAWITPAATGPAPAGLASPGDPVMSVPWSLAGLPAVSVPAGRAGALPLGLQCAGRPHADEQLLADAELVEQALARADPS